ncbi:MAG: tRNA pseudouridine(55) synthase TruB [Hominimerdicola sp.]
MNENFNGIIGVSKPEGWTSFDVIAKLRGILHIKRLGHAGTLDPLATGVLPVFVGKATKACDILPDKRKKYKAGFKFGLTTDTEDISGKKLTESEKTVTLQDIEQIIPEFIGDIMQLPPMYSAVKVDGKKLYELARQGKVIERKARPAHIDSIVITSYDPLTREGEMEIDCGQGTYVRTVISDIGEKLGAGGIMTTLVRTYSGGIDISECHTLEEIIKICENGRLSDIIIPCDKAFEIYKAVRLGERITKLYKNGVKLRPEQVGLDNPTNEIYRVYSFDGEFIGTGHFIDGEFRCHKNFC